MRAPIEALERALAAYNSMTATDLETIAINDRSTAALRQHIAARAVSIAELQKAIEMLKASQS